jgi:hypothetical protein
MTGNEPAVRLGGSLALPEDIDLSSISAIGYRLLVIRVSDAFRHFFTTQNND